VREAAAAFARSLAEIEDTASPTAFSQRTSLPSLTVRSPNGMVIGSSFPAEAAGIALAVGVGAAGVWTGAGATGASPFRPTVYQ